MAETLDALAEHLSREGDRAKIVVWEHNSHVGDARATEVGQRGELNGRDAVLVGFTTYCGTVSAASDWGAPVECKQVRPALADSYEALFHATQRGKFLLIWSESDTVVEHLRDARLERAIGVIYRAETERSLLSSAVA